MNDSTNHPLDAFIAAMGSTIGRAGLSIAALFLGIFLGGVTLHGNLDGGLAMLVLLHVWFIVCCFSVAGVCVLPAMFLFIILFVRSEWPLPFIGIVTVAVWAMTYFVFR